MPLNPKCVQAVFLAAADYRDAVDRAAIFGPATLSRG
jgi:hypothetical protein